MNGWIKLHRSLITWEWYDDINVKVTFLHLLLSANHAPKKWRGIDIGRGQLWTSIGNLAKEIGLSEKQIRNSLKKLERTNEISIKGASKGTMITVCKYDSYQDAKEDKGEQTGKPRANEGQTEGEQGATNNNDNNANNDNKEIRELRFREQVAQYTQYNSKMLEAFSDYWTESKPNGKKMKFEMQTTFDIERRLKTWNRNDFGTKEKETNTVTGSIRDLGLNPINRR